MFISKYAILGLKGCIYMTDIHVSLNALLNNADNYVTYRDNFSQVYLAIDDQLADRGR
mgnify:CR=1 FL=1